MKNPLPVNNLIEAAGWLSESTGSQWSANGLLGEILRLMLEAAKEQKYFTPILYISLPKPVRLYSRRFDPDTCTIQSRRCESFELPYISNYEDVLALFQHGSVELPYPLMSTPWSGEDEDEGALCIDAESLPDIGIDALRIYARDLLILAERIRIQEAIQDPGTQKQASPTTIVHTTNKGRSSPLAAEIRIAKENVKKVNEQNADDSGAVWNEIVRMTRAKEYSALIGFVEDEGIQYEGKNFRAGNGCDIFSRENLNDRMARERNKRLAALSRA